MSRLTRERSPSGSPHSSGRDQLAPGPAERCRQSRRTSRRRLVDGGSPQGRRQRWRSWKALTVKRSRPLRDFESKGARSPPRVVTASISHSSDRKHGCASVYLLHPRWRHGRPVLFLRELSRVGKDPCGQGCRRGDDRLSQRGRSLRRFATLRHFPQDSRTVSPDSTGSMIRPTTSALTRHAW